jgi:hypothetical protein
MSPNMTICPFFSKDINFVVVSRQFCANMLKAFENWHFALILTAQHLLQASCINRFSQPFHC